MSGAVSEFAGDGRRRAPLLLLPVLSSSTGIGAVYVRPVLIAVCCFREAAVVVEAGLVPAFSERGGGEREGESSIPFHIIALIKI